MKTAAFILLILVLQSCYQPYYKDSEWWYFDEWDTNGDSMIDKNEFDASLAKYKVITKYNLKPDSALFAAVDDNRDNEVSAIEFYTWEVSL
jgi:hypothetical protein